MNQKESAVFEPRLTLDVNYFLVYFLATKTSIFGCCCLSSVSRWLGIQFHVAQDYFAHLALKRPVCIVNLQSARTALTRVRRNALLGYSVQCCSLLFSSFHDLGLICFSLAGINSFLSSYRFIVVVLHLQELTGFPLYIAVLVA